MTTSIDNETEFEKHFCHQLDIHGNGKYRIKKFTDIKNLIIDDLCLYFQELEDFLNSTQLDKLTQYKSAMGSSWKDSLQQKIREEFSSKPLFQVLKNGISHNNFYFDLLYFQPSNESNQNAQGLYEKNRFTAIRQYHFGEESQRESLDIALALNGFVIVTIELKNQGTSGTIQDAIEQYLRRNINLPIFQKPFLHIVCDNFKVKIAAAFSKPPSEKDFRDFNKDLINIPPNNREYPVHYLYQDILLPDRILNFIEKFLYVGGDNKWIFPRYHQQRVTKNITEEIKSHFLKTNQLDLKYLIQHSTGSGKSNTIVWLVQNLRTLHANAQKIFSSVVVLTDRLNLDDQISRDFQKAILSEGIASYIDSTEDLRIALETNKQVIISTIQKFTYLKDLSLKSNKRICILIDEAHRSQEGKLHESVTQTFQSDENGIEDVPIEDVAEKVGDEIEKKRFPNLVFIALTATPSDKTLNHFGKEVRDKSTVRHEPHDVYSMKQAIEEGVYSGRCKTCVHI